MALVNRRSILDDLASIWRKCTATQSADSEPAARPDTVSAELSEAMLRFMRSPDELIEGVKESISLRDRTILATTEIQFKRASLGSGPEYRYVDILHPDKGLVLHVLVETPGVELASHAEHVAVARDAIGYRFASIVEKLSFVMPDAPDVLDRVARELAKVRADLESIPGLSRPKALAKLKAHFSLSGEQKWLSRIQGLEGVSQIYRPKDIPMHALFLLCKRLVYKYLLLVRVPVKRSQLQSIRFSVERPYSTMSIKDDKPATSRRHIFFSSTPNAFRHHTPWAKKAAHYSFTAQAPHGQFFSNVEMVSRATRATGGMQNVVIDTRDNVPFSWAISIDQGDRANFFVGNGRAWMQPLYISLTHRELPGRSLLRAATLVATALMLMATFFTLAVFFDVSLTNAIIAVLTLLTLGGLASPWPRDSGPLGIPILSRVTPIAIAAVSAIFLVWILTYDKKAHPFALPGGYSWGLLCIAGVAALLAYLGNEMHSLTQSYRFATNFRPKIGGSFQ